MSFILDALKKLEREKETRDAGVVMVGPVQWGGPDSSRRRRRRLLGGAALMALAASAIWWLAAPNPSTPSTPPAGPETPPTATGTAPRAAPEKAPETARPEPAAPRPRRGPGGESPAVTAPPPRGFDLPTLGAREEAVVPIGQEAVVPIEEETALPVAEEAQLPAPEAPVPEYRLNAISERDGAPIALLNDRLVREGDRFDGLRVIRIGTDEVEIEVDGQRRTIRF